MTDKQREICNKYSAKDEKGFVHCNECPLVLDHNELMCKGNSHYDKKKKRWVFDRE